jgi:phosphate transport system protein
MTRKLFEKELDELGRDLLALGGYARTALLDAVNALIDRDIDASKEIVSADATINERRHRLENDCLTVIATQQPMAGDLRRIASVLYIATELERIGDYAKTIAKLNMRIGTEEIVESLTDIRRMAQLAMEMLDRSLQAFSDSNTALARSIPEADDQVDDLYDKVFRHAMDHVREDTAHIDQINYLIMVAYSLERTADRVINICERVIYMVDGTIIDLDEDISVLKS